MRVSFYKNQNSLLFISDSIQIFLQFCELYTDIEYTSFASLYLLNYLLLNRCESIYMTYQQFLSISQVQ